MFRVFIKTWHVIENGKKVPGSSEKKYLGEEFEDEDDVREFCSDWNRENDQGKLSLICEYEEC